jgi:flagellar hook-associated protein 2
MTFDIKNDFSSITDPIKVTVVSDTSKTYDTIKSFVEKYNELIDKLNSKISEKKYREYTPLSDEQKSSMSEDQIKKWETKAKSGLLKDDSIISNTLSSLRSILYDSVQGTGISLYSIGITSSNTYSDRGKLIINESELKKSLANNPEDVAKLFTANSDTTYYQALKSSSDRSKRYDECGIAQRFSDIIQDAIRTNTDKDGRKGFLLEKAGIDGDRSEYNNVLYTEIMGFDKAVSEMNSKLASKESALYAKFTAMETALSKMNSQSSWLASQFGGSSGS